MYDRLQRFHKPRHNILSWVPRKWGICISHSKTHGSLVSDHFASPQKLGDPKFPSLWCLVTSAAPAILPLHPPEPTNVAGCAQLHTGLPTLASLLPYEIWFMLTKSPLLYPFSATITTWIYLNLVKPQVICRPDTQDACYTSDSILTVKSSFSFSFHEVFQPDITREPLLYGESKLLSCYQPEPIVHPSSSHFYGCFCSCFQKWVLIFVLSVAQLSLLEYTRT